MSKTIKLIASLVAAAVVSGCNRAEDVDNTPPPSKGVLVHIGAGTGPSGAQSSPIVTPPPDTK